MSRVRVPTSVLDPSHPYHRAPKGVWLIGGTGDGPYPCMCRGSRPCRRPTNESAGCPCWGRIDIDRVRLPSNCCAVRAAALAETGGGA